MKFYVSTKNIPTIHHLPLTERMQVIELASKKMTVPEKTILNILKLAIIVPVFVLLLRVTNDWSSLLWALLVLLLYPLFVKPIQYSLAAKYLPTLIQGTEE